MSVGSGEWGYMLLYVGGMAYRCGPGLQVRCELSAISYQLSGVSLREFAAGGWVLGDRVGACDPSP